MLQPLFRGGCHACFCRPDGWIPSVLVLCQHGVSPWLPKRTARSAPPSFYPPSRKLPPAAAQKFQTAYHLMMDCEQLQTPLLVSPVALIKLHRRARSRVAWTEFGGVGEGRRAVLGKSDKSSQGSHRGERRLRPCWGDISSPASTGGSLAQLLLLGVLEHGLVCRTERIQPVLSSQRYYKPFNSQY